MSTIFVQPTGTVRHPVTGRVVAPHGLNGPPGDRPVRRPPLAPGRLDVASDNPYFARAFVNRMWAHFFGRGLVEPLDDLRATNPASNEPLLDALADAFIKSRFDMRRVVTLIGSSTTYQLSATPSDNNLDETQCATPVLSPTARGRSLTRRPGLGDRRSDGIPRGFPRAPKPPSFPMRIPGNAFLSLFGRPPRESACECERVAQPSLSQSLFLMNDRFILDKVATKGGLAERLAQDARPLEARVDRLF